MNIVLVTGSCGLVGSEAVKYYSQKGYAVIGIENDIRKKLFGEEGSTYSTKIFLKNNIKNYIHYQMDIRNEKGVNKIFREYNRDIKLIIHTAAQPSHDWAASNPIEDFTINALGTINLLENMRNHSSEAVFIFTSTNKVYGNTPNFLPLIEEETRWELESSHNWFDGIDETMTVDQSLHSLFGVSKLSADLMVQEYGRYFNLKTGIFRCGCITGPMHAGTKLHGFLSYLIRCNLTSTEYNIFGYKGKQVRDNIHSYDLITAFDNFFINPKVGEVYNIGGSRKLNTSVIEAIKLVEEITGKKMNTRYIKESRVGDHIWWISGINKFTNHYPEWHISYDLIKTINEIVNSQKY